MEPEQQHCPIGQAEDYELLLKIGEGGQAHVYLASQNHQLYALKAYLYGPTKEEAFQLEVSFLQKLKHPLLVNMVDCKSKASFQLKGQPEEKRSIVVLELAEGGQLYEYMAKFGRFTPEVCRYYAKQLVQVLQFLTQKDIAHRDIKPENILFDESFSIKMSDFGLARDARGNYGDYSLFSRVGTEGYRSPEMEEGKYNGLQSDMFSIGVVIFVMYSGYPPFMGTRPHDRIYKLIRQRNFAKFWEKHQKGKPQGFYDRSFKRLMNSFFSSDPERRPTFESLEDDEWWNGEDLTPEEIQKYMSAKGEILFENSEVAAIKKEMLKARMAQEQQKIVEQLVEDECTRNCPEELPQEVEFVKTAKQVDIKLEELPEYTIKRQPYAKQEPGFVVAWLKNALSSFFRNKQTFLDNYAETIEPLNFQFGFEQQTNRIQIVFEFDIEGEEVAELSLTGQLHRSCRQGIGVRWTQNAGNHFWLAAIQTRLVRELGQLD